MRYGIALVVLAAGASGCASLQQVAALRKVNFSVGGVSRGRLAGIDLSKVSSSRDLSAADVARLAQAVSRKDLPFEFQLNLRAENPAENVVAATLVRLSWALELNGAQTIHGVMDSAVSLLPGQPATIPMRMALNLFEFLGGPAQGLVDIALSVAGFKTDPTRVTLRAVPTVDTPLGPMSYPSPITIVSRKVGGDGS